MPLRPSILKAGTAPPIEVSFLQISTNLAKQEGNLLQAFHGYYRIEDYASASPRSMHRNCMLEGKAISNCLYAYVYMCALGPSYLTGSLNSYTGLAT